MLQFLFSLNYSSIHPLILQVTSVLKQWKTSKTNSTALRYNHGPCQIYCITWQIIFLYLWVSVKQVFRLTLTIFFFQGSLSERRRSFKTEVSFESLFFCVGVGFGLIRKNSQIHSQPIRCKSRTNRELGSRVFPRLATVARI